MFTAFQVVEVPFFSTFLSKHFFLLRIGYECGYNLARDIPKNTAGI